MSSGYARGWKRCALGAVLWGTLLASCRHFDNAPEPKGNDGGASGLVASVGAAGSGAEAGVNPLDPAAGTSNVMPNVDDSGGVGSGGRAPDGSAGFLDGTAGSGEIAGAGGARWGVDSGDVTGSGDAVGPTDSGEPSFLPSCVNGYSFYPTSTTALAAAKTFTLNQLMLFTTEVTSNVTLISWATDSTPAWTSWVCWDSVPRPSRIAAMNLSNGQPEVFVTTEAGQLLVRRGYPDHWTSWLPFTTPPPHLVTDVAVADGAIPAVYVIVGGRVYARNKVDVTAYAAYGPWRLLGLERARLITAVRTSAGHDVVVETEANELLSIQRIGDDPSAGYGDWISLGHVDEALVDLDVSHGNAGTSLYGLAASGRVVNKSAKADSVWEQVRASTATPKLVALAADLTKANGEVLFGVAAEGEAYELQAGSWLPLDM